jgi:DNA-binding MarR family transcriptional regulator
MDMATEKVEIGLEPPEALPEIGERQLTCLRFLVEYGMLNSRYPTYTEIAAHMGVSRAQAGRYLEVLEKKGFVMRDASVHVRNIRVTHAGMQRLAKESKVPASQQRLFSNDE